MPIIAGVFLLYGYFGDLAPQFLANKGYSFERIVSQMSLATEGIFQHCPVRKLLSNYELRM
jgi:TRAP-type uncharacterized transport system fused permease subunit